MNNPPSFFRGMWEIPPYAGEPRHYFHRIAWVAPQGAPKKNKEGLEYSFGGGFVRQKSIQSCLGETMERFSGYSSDRKKIRLASWQAIGKEALHPTKLRLYSDSQFRSRSVRYRPFTEKTKVGWIEGFSLVSNSPIWVPSQHVFLSPLIKGEADILHRIGTGWACGSSKDQAILSALYEVVERDAFETLWLNKLSMPLVDLDSNAKLSHPIKQLFFAKLAVPHLRYSVIQMTNDLGIPAYCVIMIDKREGWPYAVIGTSAHLNAEVAIEKSVIEGIMSRSVLLYRKKQFQRFTVGKSPMNVFKSLKEPLLHGVVYADPHYFRYMEFLIASKARIPIRDLPNMSTGNRKRDLQICLSILKKRGHDVIVVDITPKELKQYGLNAVKVIIPDAQPLHFDWGTECLGNQRLYEVPVKLGYSKQPSTEKDIYRIPHPFM